jgi:hypothetical protein
LSQEIAGSGASAMPPVWSATMGVKSAFLVVVTLAAGGTAFPSPSDRPSPQGASACQRIESACAAAGYMSHGKQKNLQRDCMEPILSGRSIAGANVSAADARDCAARQRPKRPSP